MQNFLTIIKTLNIHPASNNQKNTNQAFPLACLEGDDS